jgi:putative CocE/NonD family hydrolase
MIIRKNNIEIEFATKKFLRGDLYLPKTEEKLPTLVFRTPYGKKVAQTYFFNSPEWFAEQGFAVFVQDVRGRGDSDGEFTPIRNEAIDGNLTVNWVLNQAWSNQEIFGLGYSYCGLNQIITQKINQNFKAISPALYFTNLFNDCLVQSNTVASSFLLSWAQALGATTFNNLNKHELQEVLLENSTLGLKQYSTKNWFTEWLELCESKVKIPNLVQSEPDIPTLHLGGFYDTFRRSVVSNFQEHKYSNLDNLVMGPWNHYPSKISANYDYESTSNSIWNPSNLIIDFYQKIRNKVDINLDKRVNVGVLNSGNLQISGKKWPPIEPTNINFYLGSSGQANCVVTDGKLEKDISGTSPDYLTYNHADPLILKGGDDCGDPALLELGPKIQNPNEFRFDVLTYTSDIFQIDSLFIGDAYLELYVETTDLVSQWFSRICLVNKKNISINLFDAVLTVNNLDKITKIKLEFGPVSFVIKQGEKLRIQITNGAFPRWEILRDKDGNPVVQKSVILHNINYPSKLVLPMAS